REDGIRARKLHQVYRNAVAVRNGRLLYRPPAFRRSQPARYFTGETRFQRRAEAGAREGRPHSLRRQRQRDFRRTDIRRFLHDLLYGKRSFTMCVVNRRVAYRQVPGAVSISDEGWTFPASSAAAIVNGLRVEPGSKMSVNARLRIRSRATRLRLLGLNDGRLASARISPLLASRMTRPPAFALFASTATFSSRY